MVRKAQPNLANVEGDHHKSNLTDVLGNSNLFLHHSDDLLGCVFWFTLRQGCTHEELEQSAKSAGLHEDFLPPGPTPGASFRYAINHAHVGLKGIKTEIISADTATVIAAILQREEDQTVQRVDYIQKSRVALLLRDAQGNKIEEPNVVGEVPNNPVYLRIRKLYKWHREHLTPDDLRPMCTNVVHSSSSLCLRQSGGMYFIPAEHMDTLNALCSTLAGVGSTGFLLPIFRSDAAEATLFEAAADDCNDDVGALLQELDEFDAKLDDNKTVLPKTLERRADSLKELRDKALLYARILRKDATDLEKRLDAAEARLFEVVTKRDNKNK